MITIPPIGQPGQPDDSSLTDEALEALPGVAPRVLRKVPMFRRMDVLRKAISSTYSMEITMTETGAVVSFHCDMDLDEHIIDTVIDYFSDDAWSL